MTEEPQIEIPEIVIAQYALRTFEVDPTLKLLKSLYQAHHWVEGKAVAVCHNSDRNRYTVNSDAVIDYHVPEHHPPVEGCTCGLYGTLTLDQLLREYGARARMSVAVIAAEGDTVIGSKGLRTAAARIVAYWCLPGYRPTFERQCKDAKAYDNVTAMLADYKFPEFTGHWGDFPATAGSTAVGYGGGGGGASFTSYKPPGVYVSGGGGGGAAISQGTYTVQGSSSQTVSLPVGSGIMAAGNIAVTGYTTNRRSQAAQATTVAVPWGNQASWDALEPLLKAATLAGKNAVRSALGLPPLAEPLKVVPNPLVPKVNP